MEAEELRVVAPVPLLFRYDDDEEEAEYWSFEEEAG